MRIGLVRTFGLVAALGWATVCQAADIVETAVKAGQFKTLATALASAELVDTLKGKGPFTVFAPTDEAFAKLPQETVADLLKPENRQKLVAILTYHVVPGKVTAKEVVKLRGAVTVNGQRVDIQADKDGVKVDSAKVVTTDIMCDNGVIHVIDSVILPATQTIPETAKAAGKFETLLAAAKAAGLAEVLAGEGPFTVFAPTDEAFAKLPKGTVESLLKPENKGKLADILKYHVVAGRVYSEQVLASKTVNTLQGSTATAAIQDSAPTIQGAKILATDVDASNGVIHIIDSVIMPPAKGAQIQRKLADAIAQGAPLYNAGHHSACATIYSNTMHELMSTSLPAEMKTHMTSVVQQASHTQCPTERAWILRRGMDQMFVQLETHQ